MKKIFVFVIVLIAITMVATAPAFASQYFGLELGKMSKAQVVQKLTADGARFDAGYSYKGKGSLPSIKVTSYVRFNKLGRIKEAWLQFDPNDKLYLITVTWYDAGRTFTTIQDGLMSKYSREGSKSFGFNSSQTYRDRTTEIVLARSTFGFGSNQTTTLTYTHTPSTASVRAAKNKVEQEIRKENAARTGGDL